MRPMAHSSQPIGLAGRWVTMSPPGTQNSSVVPARNSQRWSPQTDPAAWELSQANRQISVANTKAVAHTPHPSRAAVRVLTGPPACCRVRVPAASALLPPRQPAPWRSSSARLVPTSMVTDRCWSYLPPSVDRLPGSVRGSLRPPTRCMEGTLSVVVDKLAAEASTAAASSSSALSCWVEMLELDAGVLGGEPPVDTTTGPVARHLPGCDLLLRGRLVGQAAVQALLGQHGQLELGHVQPAAVLGGVVDL